jgi:hypothetical protein
LTGLRTTLHGSRPYDNGFPHQHGTAKQPHQKRRKKKKAKKKR